MIYVGVAVIIIQLIGIVSLSYLIRDKVNKITMLEDLVLKVANKEVEVSLIEDMICVVPKVDNK